jgi:hypothetical protein
MNLTTGRNFPLSSTWTRLQYASLAAGLALALSAALIIDLPATTSTGGPVSSTLAPPTAFALGAEQFETIYIVGGQAEADVLTSAANEGIGGPTRVIVATTPQDEAYISLMMTEQAHGVLQGTRIIDLRVPER